MKIIVFIFFIFFFFLSENFHFLEVKFSIHFNRCVFVMMLNTSLENQMTEFST